jgi:glycosyltransferase involved in cell wall biosynthesis
MTATAFPTKPRPAGESRERVRLAQVVTKLSAGAGVITLRGSLALDPDRYDVTILAAEGGLLTEEARRSGLQVVELEHMAGGRGIYPGDDVLAYKELRRHLDAGGFDVVHTHSAKAGALGRLAAHHSRIPAVLHTFHGFPFHSFQSYPVRKSLISIERRLGRITDYFLAAGTETAAEAVRLRLAPPDRIRAFATVPLADGLHPVTPDERRLARATLGLPEDAKVVGTVGRLDAQKSPADMVAALAALGREDVYVVWVGGGSLFDRTRRLIERRGLAGRFMLLGDRADVPALLPAFDVFALSSLYEGLPCALVEAMTCRIPVVATAVNSVAEAVISGSTGLLARPGDPRSLARALEYALDHPVEMERMAAAALELVHARCRSDLLGDAFAQSYELALRAQGRSERRGLEAVAG